MHHNALIETISAVQFNHNCIFCSIKTHFLPSVWYLRPCALLTALHWVGQMETKIIFWAIGAQLSNAPFANDSISVPPFFYLPLFLLFCTISHAHGFRIDWLFLRGVVRNFNPWVLKFCCCPFGELGFDIRRYFAHTDPSFPQKSVGSISYFSKICGSRGTHGTHANYAPVLNSHHLLGFG